jgi:hypothetical protein
MMTFSFFLLLSDVKFFGIAFVSFIRDRVKEKEKEKEKESNKDTGQDNSCTLLFTVFITSDLFYTGFLFSLAGATERWDAKCSIDTPLFDFYTLFVAGL